MLLHSRCGARKERKDSPKIEALEVGEEQPEPSEHDQGWQVRSGEGKTLGGFEMETARKLVPLAEQELAGKVVVAIL